MEMDSSLADAIARSWTLPPVPTLAVLVLCVVYLRGFRLAQRSRPEELPTWRAVSFVLGLLSFWLALASPLDALGEFLLSAHMAQHLVLMSVAPPLLLLGAPSVPLLRGLPRSFVRDDLAPWLNLPLVAVVERVIFHPAFGWLSMNMLFLAWHSPAAYDLALRSNGWHEVEHLCFFSTSTLFWWFVIAPWPSRSRWPRWAVIPYLVSADLINTSLSATLTFCGRTVYRTYEMAPRVFDLSPLDDQVAAGAGMWVLGSTIFLGPAMIQTMRMLSTRRATRRRVVQKRSAEQTGRFDLLRLPIAGYLLRKGIGRPLMQCGTTLLLVLIVWHGWRGTPLSFLNLSGTFVWSVLRPVGLLLLIVAGNVFCMACPYTLPRQWMRRLLPGFVAWPHWLRNKWIPVGLLCLFFWGYERYSLWDSPAATAWILLAYVCSALLIDAIFTGASFCKYVCPMGQFNYAASMLAPLTLEMRTKEVCSGCHTQDCVRGNAANRGCELQLYMPTKVGSMDCTLCMDCVVACPHENIALTVRNPVSSILYDGVRSSLGRLSMRKDVTALVVTLSFAAVLNAALMVAPVVQWRDGLEQAHPWLLLTAPSLMELALLVAVCAGAAYVAMLALRSFADRDARKTIAGRFAWALLPLCMAIWGAHLGFHLSAGTTAVVPTFAQAASELVGTGKMQMNAGEQMAPAMCRPADVQLMPGSKGFDLLSVQLWILNVGLLMSWYLGWRVGRDVAQKKPNRLALNLVWMMVTLLLYGASFWTFLQPMQMRGME